MGLRAWLVGWLVDRTLSGGLGGVEGSPHNVEPQHRLDVICQELGATYDRTREPNNMVLIRLHLPSGEVIVGRGPTTAEAVQDAGLRVEAWKDVEAFR